MLRLKGPDTMVATANFFASGLFKPRAKLGPILWQFPPSVNFKPDVFETFLQLLPRDTEAAAALAKQHDVHVKRPCVTPDRKRRLRYAIEIRHPSFCDEAFVKLLRKYGAALVVSDSVMGWPYAEDLSSDFVYIRLHGPETLYGGQYSDAALDRWIAGPNASALGLQAANRRMPGKSPGRLPGGARHAMYFAISTTTRRLGGPLMRAA